jgi:hypothetical protein
MKSYVQMLLVFALLWSGWLPAQSISGAERALYELTDTELLKRYRDYRTDAEKYVALFKVNEEHFSPEEKIEMQTAYRATSEAFESFIYAIRNDFLDAKQRRKIRRKTEAYVTYQLEKLDGIYTEYYMGRFYPTYSAIALRQGEYTASNNRLSEPVLPASIPIALLIPVASSIVKVMEHIEKRKGESLEEFKQVLDQEWVEPHQFRDWEDI